RRCSQAMRRYGYRFCDGYAMAALCGHDTWHLGGPRLDVDAMAAGARHLLGEHDFSSFCRRAGDQHLVRRIDGLAVRRARADLVVVAVAGTAFWHQMVRRAVG